MTSDRGGQAFRLGLFLLPSSALLSGICLFVAVSVAVGAGIGLFGRPAGPSRFWLLLC